MAQHRRLSAIDRSGGTGLGSGQSDVGTFISLGQMKAKQYIIRFADSKNWRLSSDEVTALAMCRMYVATMHDQITKDLIVRELRSIDSSAELVRKVEEDYTGSIIEATLRYAMDRLTAQIDLEIRTDT